MRVLIDARILPDGHEGGIEQYLIGLVHGLSQLDNNDDEYLIVGHWREPNWLAPYLGPHQSIIKAPKPPKDFPERVKSLLGPLRAPLGNLWRHVNLLSIDSTQFQQAVMIPTSTGFLESFEADVLHITYPLHFFHCTVPTVFSIYDLQHRHYPQFCSAQHLTWREKLYSAAFEHSRVVVAGAKWVADDIVEQYQVEPHKVSAVPLASPSEAYEEVTDQLKERVQHKYRLPPTFLLYPSLTYEHKNHIRLLDAIALLRDEYGLTVNLVCTGKQRHYWPTIKEHLRRRKLQRQVKFLGFVSTEELRALYHLAKFALLPSLFEGIGLSLLEAFQERTPVACSDIPAFREYGGEAVLFFNPSSVSSIAQAIQRMSTGQELLSTLAQRGSLRVRNFTWERTAKLYRAIYRAVAGELLSDEDCELLQSSGSNGSVFPQIKAVR